MILAKKYFGSYFMVCTFDFVIVIVINTNKAGVISQGDVLCPRGNNLFSKVRGRYMLYIEHLIV